MSLPRFRAVPFCRQVRVHQTCREAAVERDARNQNHQRTNPQNCHTSAQERTGNSSTKIQEPNFFRKKLFILQQKQFKRCLF